MNRYIVMSSHAKPGNNPSRYRRVAVVETDLPEGQKPKMISERAKGVVRIVKVWERCNVGVSDKCEYKRRLDEAFMLAVELNTRRYAATISRVLKAAEELRR